MIFKGLIAALVMFAGMSSANAQCANGRCVKGKASVVSRTPLFFPRLRGQKITAKATMRVPYDPAPVCQPGQPCMPSMPTVAPAEPAPEPVAEQAPAPAVPAVVECQPCQPVCSNCQPSVSASVSVNIGAGVSAQWGPPHLAAIALQSARYRAARRIKGHCHIDMQHTSGVGWASHNSTPRTCYWEKRNVGGYAAVRGADGWYSALILR
jgi:hypothetical protein